MRRTIVLPAICFFLLTASPVKGQDTTQSVRKEKVSTFERSFKPSEYDLDLRLVHKGDSTSKPEYLMEHFTTAQPETVQGFRIQVFTSNAYDEALDAKNTLSAQLPDEWVYLVYDAPTYKVRVGDYLTRIDANQAVGRFVEKGYAGAWVVPDQVIKNPPPKPPQAVPDSTSVSSPAPH